MKKLLNLSLIVYFGSRLDAVNNFFFFPCNSLHVPHYATVSGSKPLN